MTTYKSELNIDEIVQKYLRYCYNECADSFVVVKDGVEMTAADWCHRFGGTPDGKSNFEFLNEQFKGILFLSANAEEKSSYDD